MFFSCPPALFCAVATQDVTPLHAALLELAAKSEALALTLTEKNERVLQQRMVFLSEALATQSLAENQAMNAAIGDGLE